MKDVKSTSYQLRADELCKSRAADAELRPVGGGKQRYHPARAGQMLVPVSGRCTCNGL